MTGIPSDFASEANQAFMDDDQAHLTLLLIELEGLGFESAGKVLINSYLEKLPPSKKADRVVLFTGHRIDAPDRPTPRFPANAEPLAADAIAGMLKLEQQQGRVTGIAGAANGGDVLFLEACRDLALPFKILLALPEEQFIQRSVIGPPGQWVSRFHSLTAQVKPAVLAHSTDLPHWLLEKPDYNFWARNNRWMISAAVAAAPRHFTLAALWDGQKGDGAGGTEDMVTVAQQHGARFIHLDTRAFLKDKTAIRTAKR